MIRMIPAAIALLVLCPLAMAQPESAPAEAEWPAIGTAAPEFSLPNLLDENGAEVSLSGLLSDNDFVAVVWHSVTCPFCVPYDAVLPGMAAEYADQGVAFVGINSNVTESPEQIVEHLTEAGFNFPILRDEGNVVADEYGAERTPEVYVVDAQGALRYHGRINDSPRDPDAAQNHDLRNALDALIAGVEPPVTETIARGCTIKRVDD